MAVDSKNLAAGYLANHLSSLTDPFQLCLVTYALYTANHRAKGQAFKLMDAAKRQGIYPISRTMTNVQSHFVNIFQTIMVIFKYLNF